ncbi:MAG: AAA family ATPase [Candidatus Eremiobacterota bacterium]
MARIVRYAAATWTDPGGHAVAALAEDPDLACFASDRRTALEDLRAILTLLHRHEPWRSGPELSEARPGWVRVRLRPEYRVGNRVFPCEPSLNLRFGYVFGEHASGLWLCTVPSLGLEFLYEQGRDLKELVVHYVQDRLAGMAPSDLTRQAPPQTLDLDEVAVRVPTRPVRRTVEGPGVLEEVAEPLSERLRPVRAYGRDELAAELEQRLLGEHVSVLVVGPSGCGKSTLIAEAVRRAEKRRSKQEPPRCWFSSGSRLIAGMRFLGQWEERLDRVISRLGRWNGILCLDNLLELVRLGGCEPSDSLAAYLAPFLERGELQVVTEATPEELDACRRLLPGLADLFQVVTIPGFSSEQAREVLAQLASVLEQQHRVRFAEGCLAAVYRLFARFMPYSPFPGQTVAFVRELAQRTGVGADPKGLVDRAAAIERFSQRTGLPERFLRDEEPLQADQVQAWLRERVVGQEEACRVGADLVAAFKAGLNDPDRPLGVLLFCGPTGVGKTQMARSLGKLLYGAGDGERLVRLDMSEYSGPLSAERLLGTIDGRPSELVRKIRRQPFTVVLLDEIEKAHPEVFDVLLRVLDEGRLTDGFGRVTDFRCALVVMTSNLGAESLKSVGFLQRPTGSYGSAVQGFFRPEFFNRVDRLVQFHPLSAETVRQLAAMEVVALEEREGLQRRGIRLSASDRLLGELASRGYDARYGARPLQRAVEDLLVTALSAWIIEHPDARMLTLHLDWDGGLTMRA